MHPLKLLIQTILVDTNIRTDQAVFRIQSNVFRLYQSGMSDVLADAHINQEFLRNALEQAILGRESPILADTFTGNYWASYTDPVEFVCDDGLEYVVKGCQVGRPNITDQVVARLGTALGAPVGKPKLIAVGSDLISMDSKLSHMSQGLAHGTLRIPGCSDRAWIAHKDVPDNRPRFALLSVLYGWAYANDPQFIYSNTKPHLVYSVDHSHFLPGGTNWQVSTLSNAPSAQVDLQMIQSFELTSAEVDLALQELNNVTEEQIIQAVASPPDEWGFTIEERIAMVDFFVKRRKEILSTLPDAL